MIKQSENIGFCSLHTDGNTTYCVFTCTNTLFYHVRWPLIILSCITLHHIATCVLRYCTYVLHRQVLKATQPYSRYYSECFRGFGQVWQLIPGSTVAWSAKKCNVLVYVDWILVFSGEVPMASGSNYHLQSSCQSQMSAYQPKLFFKDKSKKLGSECWHNLLSCKLNQCFLTSFPMKLSLHGLNTGWAPWHFISFY